MTFQRRLRSLLLTLVAVALLAVAIFPMAWTVVSSLRAHREIVADPLGMPAPPTWANYSDLLTHRLTESAGERGPLALVTFYRNSIVASAVSLVVVLVTASAAGYALARMRFPGRGLAFGLLMLGLMVPVHATLLPLRETMLGLPDTPLRLVGPYVAFALPIGIFILRGFFAALPRELEEAARIDGCGPWRTFWHVMLPTAWPALATVLILNFVTMWNEFVFALTLLDEPDSATLPTGLVTLYRGEFTSDYGTLCATTAMTVLPLVIVFLAAQKKIVKGMTAGALVGTGVEA